MIKEKYFILDSIEELPSHQDTLQNVEISHGCLP